MSHPNNTVAARRHKVAALYLQGIPQYQIAEQLAVHPGQISRDLAIIRAAWLESSIQDFDARKAQELAKIDCVEAEAWAAYERSCKPRERSRAKHRLRDGSGQTESQKTEAEKVTEGRDGNPKFLEVIKSCVELRAKIFGLLKLINEHSGHLYVTDATLDRLTPDDLRTLILLRQRAAAAGGTAGQAN